MAENTWTIQVRDDNGRWRDHHFTHRLADSRHALEGAPEGHRWLHNGRIIPEATPDPTPPAPSLPYKEDA